MARAWSAYGTFAGVDILLARHSLVEPEIRSDQAWRPLPDLLMAAVGAAA
jgi:hypothetical protein